MAFKFLFFSTFDFYFILYSLFRPALSLSLSLSLSTFDYEHSEHSYLIYDLNLHSLRFGYNI